MSEQEMQSVDKPAELQPPEGVAAATAAGAAAGPAGGIAALRGAYARARSFAERPHRGGLIALGVIAVALVTVFFLFPWRAPQGGDERQEAVDRITALEESTATLQGDLDTTARRLSALERAYEALAAEGAGVGDAASLSARVAGLVTSLEELSARVDGLEARGLAPEGEGTAQAPAPAGLADLRARVSELESELNALNAAVKGRLDAVEARIGNDFANRLSAVEQAQSSGPSKADIEGLAARITLLESNESAAAMRRATRALAVSALSQAVRSGAPFTAELALVGDFLGEDEALVTLKARAGEGIPSAVALQRAFADASRAALAARDKAEGRPTGFFAHLWRSITSLVTVRRTDGAGDDLEPALARIDGALSRQDVAAALNEVKAITGAPQAALASWLAKAQEHVDAENALRALQASVLRDLAQN
jgi:hypothetical protein